MTVKIIGHGVGGMNNELTNNCNKSKLQEKKTRKEEYKE